MQNYLFKLYLFLGLLVSSYGANVLALNVNVKIGDRLVQATVYEGRDDDLFIWIPSEYGVQGSYRNIAKKISQFGIEVWFVDMFAANYLTPSVNAMYQIPAVQVSDLISQVIKYSSKRVWLMSSEKGAYLALSGIYHWQKNNPKNNEALGGAILLNPDLIYGSPPVGQDPDYLPVTSVMNKPIAIVQSRLSKQYYYLPELVEKLQKGGAKVETYIIEDVRDKFHFRKYTEEVEDKIRDKQLPSFFIRAMKGLVPSVGNVEPHKKIPKHLSIPNVDLPLNVTPVLQPKKMTPIALNDNKGTIWDTNVMKGKVLLVSFWPYWCASCRYQLKQHQDLYDQVKGNTFNLLSIYFDGKKSDIKKLIKRYKVKYPLLQGDIELIKKFNLREFPSTLIVDKKGKVRYAMHGVSRKSDTKLFVEIIDRLKKEK